MSDRPNRPENVNGVLVHFPAGCDRFTPTAVQISDYACHSAVGVPMTYSQVDIVARIDGWTCRFPILRSEHNERIVQRAVRAACQRWDIEDRNVFDLRGEE